MRKRWFWCPWVSGISSFRSGGSHGVRTLGEGGLRDRLSPSTTLVSVLLAMGASLAVETWLVLTVKDARVLALLTLVQVFVLLSPLFLQRVEVVLVGFVALLALGALGRVLGGDTTLNPLVGLWMAGLWGLRFVVHRPKLVWAPELTWMAVYGALALIASLGGQSLAISFRPLLTTAQLLVFTFLVVQLVREPRWAYAVGWALIGSLTLIALLLLAANWTGWTVLGVEQVTPGGIARFGGIVSGLNTSAILLAVGTIFALAYLGYARRLWVKVLLLLCALAMAVAILQTASLTGLLALGLGVAVLGSGFYRRPNLRRAVLVLVLIVGGLSAVYLLSSSIQQRVQYSVGEVTGREFNYWFTHRGATWQAALEVVKRYPLLGAGVANGQYVLGGNFWVFNPNENIGAHNTYLSIAMDTGVPAILIFTLTAFGALYGLYRVLRKSPVLANRSPVDSEASQLLPVAAATFISLLCLLLVGSMALSMERVHYLWLLLGLAIAIRLQVKRLEGLP